MTLKSSSENVKLGSTTSISTSTPKISSHLPPSPSLVFLPNISNMYDLKNRRVLITGASRGLGAAIAKAFAEEGCDLAITYLSSLEKAEAIAADIMSSTGRKVVVLQAVSCPL